MRDDEELFGIAGVDFFFTKEVDCHELADSFTKKHLLPNLGLVYGEEANGKVYMGWQMAGLAFQIEVALDAPIAVRYPDFRMGDSIELFIDTRSLTTSKTTHRFFHHFYILAERFEGRLAGECTRFRTEDSHPLCNEEALDCTVEPTKKGYKAHLFIPKECLVGYDPQKGGRIGFSYRINRSSGDCQHFAMASDDPKIDSMPSLLATMELV